MNEKFTDFEVSSVPSAIDRLEVQIMELHEEIDTLKERCKSYKNAHARISKKYQEKSTAYDKLLEEVLTTIQKLTESVPK